jgi:hypothetical protein
MGHHVCCEECGYGPMDTSDQVEPAETASAEEARP